MPDRRPCGMNFRPMMPPTCTMWAAAVLLAVTAMAGCERPFAAGPSVDADPQQKADRVAELRALGQRHLEAGSYNDAYVAFREASEHVEGDLEIAWGMAQTLSKLRNEVEALDWVNRALQIQPDTAGALELKGRILLRLGRVQDAIGVLERTVDKHPDYTLAWLNLSAAYDAAQQLDKAIQAAQAAARTDADAATPHFALGDIYSRQDRLAAAEEQYRLAIHKDPTHALSHMRLSELYIRQKKDLDQARQLALLSEQLDPGDGTAASAAAWVLFLQDRKQEAFSEMLKAAESHPQNYQIWMRLGAILDDMGEKEKAQEAYDTAARFAPRTRSLSRPTGQQGFDQGAN